MKIGKISFIVLILLSLVSVAIFGASIYAYSDAPSTEIVLDVLRGESDADVGSVLSMLEISLMWTIGLIGLAVFTIVIVSLINIVGHPKKAIKGGIGILGLATILGVSYSMGGTGFPADKIPFKNMIKDGVSVESIASTVHITDMYLYTTYTLLALAVLSIVFITAKNALK